MSTIAGISRVINLYLAPVLSLTSLVLITIAYLAPTVMLHTQVSLMDVTPTGGDGPSVFMGALGSCARPNNNGGVTCTPSSIDPTYDLSVLPSNAPDLLDAPTSTTPGFIAFSLALAIIFFVMFTLTAFRPSFGRFGNWLDRPSTQRITAWIGLGGFMIGITSFLIIRMWFGKAIQDFNDDIAKVGSDAPQLHAVTTNGFIMIWVAYSFYAVPLVCSLAKMHVTATAAPGKA